MKSGVPKIADFGLTASMRSSGLSTRMGTPFYVACEVISSPKYDFKADIWSLGMVFLEILSGKRIFSLIGGNAVPSLRSDFPSEDIFNRIKSDRLRNLMSKMLQKEPSDRLSAQ
jgi:serine/threonine protein kinase